MDPEERQILEQYRCNPEYYRRLEEFRAARRQAQQLTGARTLLGSKTAKVSQTQQTLEAEPPHVTDYYRRHYEQQLQQEAALATQRGKPGIHKGARTSSATSPPQTIMETESQQLPDEEGI